MKYVKDKPVRDLEEDQFLKLCMVGGWPLACANPFPAVVFLKFPPIQSCLAITTHNFKWLKITDIYLTL